MLFTIENPNIATINYMNKQCCSTGVNDGDAPFPTYINTFSQTLSKVFHKRDNVLQILSILGRQSQFKKAKFLSVCLWNRACRLISRCMTSTSLHVKTHFLFYCIIIPNDKDILQFCNHSFACHAFSRGHWWALVYASHTHNQSDSYSHTHCFESENVLRLNWGHHYSNRHSLSLSWQKNIFTDSSECNICLYPHN